MRRAIGNQKLMILCLVLVCIVIVMGINNYQDNDVAYADVSAQPFATSHEICTPSDLLTLADEVNKGLYDGFYGIKIELKNDIDIGMICEELDCGAGWIPIGTSTYPFKGDFNGNGYTINGLYINKEDTERVGLFGNTHFNATISNLTVAGFVKGNNYTGGIVGYNQAQIENCVNITTVDAKDGSMHLGGIAGYNSGTISKSGNMGSINAGFVNFVAGIAGSNIGVVKECYNNSNLNTMDSVIGAIVGNNSLDGVIEICLNGQEISGKASVGGIVGSNYGFIKNVFNSGSVNSVNGTAGGITGYNDESGDLSYVLTASKVTGAEDIAAVCGYNRGLVRAAFYDNTIYEGALLNGLTAEYSAGLTTRILSHSDVLNVEDKLGALTESNPDMWTKTSFWEQGCHYPQLIYFLNNLPSLSSQVCSVTQTQLDSKDVTLGKTSFVYDGEDHTVDIYYGDILLELEQDYNVRYDDNVNAGTVEVSVTFINSFSGSAIKIFTIEQSVLTVAWDVDKYIYDGETHIPTVKVINGLINGESVIFDYSDVTAINVGEYYVKADLSNASINSNYSLPVTELWYEISPAVITVDWMGDNFVYNGNLQRPTAFVLTGRVGNDDITFRYEGLDNINAGEQSVTAFLQDTSINSNYLFAGDTYIYTIAKQPITIEWEDSDFYYNGFVQYPKARVSSGKINDDDITFDYCGYENNIQANEDDGYTVTVTLADTKVNANYYFEDVSIAYFICKVPLTLAWWDITLEYTGLPQYPPFYIEQGLIGEEEVEFDLSDYSHNVNASFGNAYTINVSLSDNPVNSNYSLKDTSKSYDIFKADFDLYSVEFRSRTLGYDGAPKNIEIDNDLPIGVDVVYDNNILTDIGEYIVTAKFSVDLVNYNPLEYDTLQVKIYIAQMIFRDASSGIIVTNKGSADSLLQLDLVSKSKSSLKESGKKVFLAYEVDFGNVMAEYSVPISEKLQKSKGLKVLCKNASGEVVAVDFIIEDSMIIFSAEDIVEFAIITDYNFTALWIVLVVIGVAILAGGVVSILNILKRHQRSAAKVNISGTLADAQTTLTIDDNAVQAAENVEELSNEEVLASENIAQEDQDNNRDILPTQQSHEIGSDNSNIEVGTEFVFDGVKCASLEWFMKSLGVKTVSKQERICAGDDYALLLFEARPLSVVYWQGKRYRIGSNQYEKLIKRAREASNEKN